MINLFNCNVVENKLHTVRARLVQRCLSFHNSVFKTYNSNPKLITPTQTSPSLKNCKTLVWTHNSVTYLYNFSSKPWTPPTDTTQCCYYRYPHLINKKNLPPLLLPHILSPFISLTLPLFYQIFAHLSFFVSPFFTLYLIFFFHSSLFLSQLSLSLPSSICI